MSVFFIFILSIHLVWLVMRGAAYPKLLHGRMASFLRITSEMSPALISEADAKSITMKLFHPLVIVLCVISPAAAMYHEIQWHQVKRRFSIVRTKRLC